MTGISSYGAYVPLHRLSRAEIASAWGDTGAPPGEKAVAGYDEDSITMAVAAARDCLTGIERDTVDHLYFASTTSPYREKQAASVVAGALGLRSDTLTMDFAGSLRAGTNALIAGVNAVRSGAARHVLIACGETRLGAPKGDKERAFGDGAAAILVADSEVVASIETTYSVFRESHDTWRSDQDVFVRSWEDRFVREAVYSRVVSETISAALDRSSLSPGDFSKAAIYAPDPRLLSGVAGKLGFDPKSQLQDPLYQTVGNTGAALPLMMLVGTLEEAAPDDRILVAGYGDGCDVLILNVAATARNAADTRGIRRHVESKRMIPSYLKYMQWRRLAEIEAPPRPPIDHISASALWRDREWGLALRGVRCNRCGTPQYPPQRICVACQTKDDFEPYSFADRKATLSSFSHDNLAAAIDPPTTVGTVDFDGGGRILMNMTDRDAEEVHTGMPVEMTFRKLHYWEGIHNYWWKCMPIRCQQNPVDEDPGQGG